jgi:hypothetical protein
VSRSQRDYERAGLAWALAAGLAVPLLPAYLATALVRRFSVDYFDSVVAAVFGLAGLAGGIVSGYLSPKGWLLSGCLLAVLQSAAIVIGGLANAAMGGYTAYFFSPYTLVTLLCPAACGALLGSSFGELVARRELQKGRAKDDSKAGDEGGIDAQGVS